MKRQIILLTLMTLLLTLSACASPYEARTPINQRSGTNQTAEQNRSTDSGNANQQDAARGGSIGRNPRAANNSYSTTGTVLPTAQEVQAARSGTPNQYGNRRALGRGFGFPNVPATTLNTEDDPLR